MKTIALGFATLLLPLLLLAQAQQETLEPPEPESEEPVIEAKVPVWNCRIDSKPRDGEFTVGEKFIIICEGPSVEFAEGKIHFQMPEKSLYAIKVLSADRVTSNEILLTATSYLAGAHDLKEIVLVQDLEEKFKVKPFQLNVKSVIKNPMQKPYGPIGAMKLAYPAWMWFALLGIVLFIIFFSLFRIQRRAQRLRVLEELKKHNTALGSYNQLNKDLRKLGRKYVFSVNKKWHHMQVERYVEALDEMFRLYLLREFVVPALEWKSTLVLREIKRSDRRHYDRYGDQLKEFLKELDRARGDIDKVKMEDCKQLTQMARRVSQNIWQSRKGAEQ